MKAICEPIKVKPPEKIIFTRAEFEAVKEALKPFAVIAEKIGEQVNDDGWLEKPLFYAGDNDDPQKWTITGKGFQRANNALAILEKRGG